MTTATGGAIVIGLGAVNRYAIVAHTAGGRSASRRGRRLFGWPTGGPERQASRLAACVGAEAAPAVLGESTPARHAAPVRGVWDPP